MQASCRWEKSGSLYVNVPVIFGTWIFFVLSVTPIQTQYHWQKVKPSTGPRPRCWQPGWGVSSRPPSASLRAGRSSRSTRLSLSPSRPWCCLLHSARCPPRSTTPSTPRWLLRLNASKGQNTEQIDVRSQNKLALGGFEQSGRTFSENIMQQKLLKMMIVSTVQVSLFSSDGPGEKRLTFTAWSPPLVSCLTRTSAASTGPSSGPWLGCTRRPTRACRSTCVHLPPCAEGCVACHPKREVRHL